MITSIAGPTSALRTIARTAREEALPFILVGDAASPPDLALDGCDFFPLDRQRSLGFEFAELCPEGHYARKNIGYLIAIERSAAWIVETDDDTVTYPSFWRPRNASVRAAQISEAGWVNVYGYFSRARIWPRGLPLDAVRTTLPPLVTLPVDDLLCPIQQGLIDDDPDVDAVYRLLFDLPLQFDSGPPIALAAGAWCPFNSQNTTWFPDAFPLMYLPAYCSFRMTDIWRSFVAQRIAWENGWSILFHEATIRQRRNDHDLTRDFAQEVPGYLNNRAICGALDGLTLRPGREHLAANMATCYDALAAAGFVDEREPALLAAWLRDLAHATTPLEATPA